MKTLLVASLFLAPVLAHAQAPQQVAKLDALKTFAGDVPAPRRVSTGVTAPKLIKVSDVIVSPSMVWGVNAFREDRKVTVAMIVDEKGVPTDLKVVNSSDAELDKDVLAAVAQYRFTPGTVSNTPVAAPVNLEVTVRSPLSN